jgi:hypothetical protein
MINVGVSDFTEASSVIFFGVYTAGAVRSVRLLGRRSLGEGGEPLPSRVGVRKHRFRKQNQATPTRLPRWGPRRRHGKTRRRHLLLTAMALGPSLVLAVDSVRFTQLRETAKRGTETTGRLVESVTLL